MIRIYRKPSLHRLITLQELLLETNYSYSPNRWRY